MLLKSLEHCNKCRDEFITDIDNLCNECPIHQQISDVRKNMIDKFAVLKEVESRETIVEYLKGNITEGRAKIVQQFNWESVNKDDPQIKYRPNRISIVLSSKDCTKYYSEQLNKYNLAPKRSTTYENPKSFSEFFIDESNENIQKIQKEFKGYSGKKMAILIYLLQDKLKKVTIIHNSKTQSRKQFVVSLTGRNDINMQPVNNVFKPNTDELKLLETDPDYIDINGKLNKLLSN
jgi:predicted transcriptional regulator